MAKKKIELTFTFVDPNTPKEIENALKTILIHKLLALHADPSQMQKV